MCRNKSTTTTTKSPPQKHRQQKHYHKNTDNKNTTTKTPTKTPQKHRQQKDHHKNTTTQTPTTKTPTTKTPPQKHHHKKRHHKKRHKKHHHKTTTKHHHKKRHKTPPKKTPTTKKTPQKTPPQKHRQQKHHNVKKMHPLPDRIQQYRVKRSTEQTLWKYTSPVAFVYWNFSNPKQRTTKHDRHSQNKSTSNSPITNPFKFRKLLLPHTNREVLYVSSGDFITCLTLLFLERKLRSIAKASDQKLFFQQSQLQMNSKLQTSKTLFLPPTSQVVKRTKSKPTLLS